MARHLRSRISWLFRPRVSAAERQMAAFAAHQRALARATARNRPAAAAA